MSRFQVALSFLVAGASLLVPRPATSQQSPKAEAVRQWIADLDNDDYARRETASRQLLALGLAAVEPLAEAASGESLEVSSRAMHILSHLCIYGDEKTEKAAVKVLEELAASSNPSAAWRANSIMQWIKERRQQEALDALARLGANVSIHPGIPVTVRIGPEWKGGKEGLKHLRDLYNVNGLYLDQAPIGDDEMSMIAGMPYLVRLSLSECRVTGAGLAHLKNMTEINYLSLRKLSIDDASVAHLQRMANLQYLQLNECPIGDAALAHLQKLSQLSSLWLGSTKITDAGLEHLKGLTNLRMLDLSQTAVSGSGFVHLKNLGGLTVLYLQGTKLEPASLAHLAELKQVYHLRLDDIPLTDDDLAPLGKMKALQALWLANAKITDKGLEHLRGVSNLRMLYLQGTKVTDEGVERFRKALPECRVNK